MSLPARWQRDYDPPVEPTRLELAVVDQFLKDEPVLDSDHNRSLSVISRCYTVHGLYTTFLSSNYHEASSERQTGASLKAVIHGEGKENYQGAVVSWDDGHIVEIEMFCHGDGVFDPDPDTFWIEPYEADPET